MKGKSGISDTVGSSRKAKRTVPVVTPKTAEKRLSNAEEAIVLHLAMVLALFQVTATNVDRYLTAEQIKEQLDSSKMLPNSGFPELDVGILQLAFGKYRNKLENFFGVRLIDYKSSDNTQNAVVGGLGDVTSKCRVYKAKFQMLKTRPNNLDKCRESVQKYRMSLLGNTKSLYDITNGTGLDQLVTFTTTAGPKEVPTAVPQSAPPTRQLRKQFHELSRYRKEERAKDIIQTSQDGALACHGQTI